MARDLLSRGLSDDAFRLKFGDSLCRITDRRENGAGILSERRQFVFCLSRLVREMKGVADVIPAASVARHHTAASEMGVFENFRQRPYR